MADDGDWRAYSVDKMFRIAYGYGWWPDEQPSEEIRQYVERQLDGCGWNIDVVLRGSLKMALFRHR